MTATMKRVLGMAFALVVALSIFALAGCGGGGKSMADSKYVGTWEATTAEYGDLQLNVADIMDEFTIELKADGTATATVDGETGSGNWEETDTGIKLTDANDELEFTDSDGKLTIEQDGVIIYFEKQ